MNTTSFSLVYDSFLSKITDDMYLELTELDTFRMLEQLLLSAIEKFEFPRIDLWDYDLFDIVDETTYQGAESNDQCVPAIIYGGGCFNNLLTHEEINILAVYMIVEWISQQLASIENTRMKYSGSDFKFTSQANHMQKLLQLKKDYEREGFHLQRLYKRRAPDKNGIMRSTLGLLRSSVNYTVDDLVDKRLVKQQIEEENSSSSENNEGGDNGRNTTDQNYITASTTRPLNQEPGDIWVVLEHQGA